jgi:uncharacterized protein (DUF342 family)
MTSPGGEGNYELHSRVAQGKLSVRILSDGMEATMLLSSPRSEGQPLTLPEALTAIMHAGVTFGVDPQAVEEALETNSDTAVVIAQGKAPVHGVDAVVTYHELLQTPTGYPQLKTDGGVDHFQLNLVRNVSPGAILATRVAAQKGTPGMTVLGGTIPCQEVRDHPLRVGKGCRLSDDGLSVEAELDGHAVLGYDGRISISPIFEIRGDVDASTGNIEFIGTVIIMGGVNQGYSVKAGQSVEIHGGIDGGTVDAGGDIVVRYGILGGNRGRVIAGGRIQCRFVENGDIRSAKDLLVSDGILHSRVRCGGRVLVNGRRGSIIGGSIKAREEVSSKIIGSALLTTSEIEVGVSPETREELDSLKRSLHEVEEGYRKSVQAVTLLRDLETRNPQGFTDAKRAMLIRALRSQYHFQAECDRLVQLKTVLEEELQQTHTGRVRAYDMAYPGVKITIGKVSYHVRDALQNVCFYLSSSREIDIGPA